MSDFWIEHRKSSFGYRLQPHGEHSYQVVFLIAGKIRFHVADKQYIVEKGGLILLNTLEEHNLEVLEYPYERYVFKIDPVFFQNEVRSPELISLFVKRSPFFSHRLTFPETIWAELMEIIRELEKEYKENREYGQLIIGADLRRFFITFYRECKGTLPQITPSQGMITAYKVLNYLDRNYQENITIESLASRFHLASHYLSHLFKDETGYSLIGYVILLRINRAKILLSETEKSISDIALECGYSDFSYFSRQFRRLAGKSPRVFREDRIFRTNQ